VAVFAAVDIGASGGRVVRGVVDGERVKVDVVYRFPNGVVAIDGHLRWDIAALHQEVVAGLALVPDAQSIGIDTWGVDYGLLDGNGELLASPISYRDDRTATVIDEVHNLVPAEELYAITGIQHLPFNTIYQLAADDLRDRARHALLLPDLMAYLLTGEQRSELTNASTTALLDGRTQQWRTSPRLAATDRAARHPSRHARRHPSRDRGIPRHRVRSGRCPGRD
jgi:rhamnulokinase